ncbi:heat shock protein 75 kDa, mitochondrial [Trichonephila inaurata madagascariensis]|uniref:Heat shock protein 75 kDa, mitochondrial n=1 Tax=Trichonephila inaurata madagascariensis TaxID=2747483 RepID=A0A8X6I9B1_9ARAC|nr:heat shock protein 75 kDa, mitochondrial [Trichonephila inaurata madagascariensis]
MAASIRFAVCRSLNNFSRKSIRTYSRFTKSSVRLIQKGPRPHCQRNIQTCSYLLSQQEPVVDPDYHSIIKDTEKSQGDAEKLEFQAETRMLLDIVAKSLYSDKEVFVRELISNASDALEKLRHAQLSNAVSGVSLDTPHEIHIATDKQARTFTIQDTGIGMTKEEMINCLGTIARSGSKAFLEEVKKNETTSCAVNKIIGQFGVGFYSTFMVADKVEVYSKSHVPESKAYKWVSDGSGSFEIMEADGVQPGTKIVVHLKSDCREFSDEGTVKDIINKYSNFVGNPIYVNGKKANNVQAVWLMEPKETTPQMHNEFFRYIANSYDLPRFTLHYKTDSPINLRCLLYIPEGKPGLFEMSREVEVGVALYSQRVLIRSKADILPKWLRFVRGVVDSEDIPLNLSRELLQDSALIRKISTMITNKMLRFLHDQMKKDVEQYEKFHDDYGIFLKEGILSTSDQVLREDIAKLLLFESSIEPEGKKVSLAEYVSRMKEGQRDVYFLAAPSRHLAEVSPYYEAVRQKDVEVIFCYEPYDELVLFQLRQFDFKNIISVEKEMRREKENASVDDLGENAVPKEAAESLIKWLSTTLGPKVHKIIVTKRLSTHPCLISVEEMSAARHYVRTTLQTMTEEQRYKILEPTLELNLSHPIIKKLSLLQNENPKLAELLAHQVFDTAMVSAGLVDDPRKVTTNLNELLCLLLEKH